MNILITCPLPLEFNVARNQLGLKEVTAKKDKPRVAKKENITLVCTGIGKINTLLHLYEYLTLNHPDLVIETGTCGSVNPKIGINHIISSYKCMDFFNIGSLNVHYVENKERIESMLEPILLSEYVIASMEKSVVSKEDSYKIADSGADIVTWETSSVFAICNKLNIPVVAIRGVTDMCNNNTFKDFKLNRVEVCKKLYNSVKTLCMSI